MTELCMTYLASCIKQRGLDAGGAVVGKGLFNREVDSVAWVWIHVGEWEEVGRANEEVSVESVDV